jgi:hypothetical protein
MEVLDLRLSLEEMIQEVALCVRFSYAKRYFFHHIFLYGASEPSSQSR